MPFSVPVAPKAAKVAPPSELTLKITVPVGVTPALVTVAVSVILPPTVIVVADSSVAVVELHIGRETLLVFNVTAPVCANKLPFTFAPLFRVMDVRARIFPTNVVVVPRVAELPTCQNTLQSEPPLITLTTALLAVVSVLPIRKMKTELGSPWASRVTVPVN